MKENGKIAIKALADNSILELYFLDAIGDTYDWWSDAYISQVQSIIDRVRSYNPSNIKITIDSVGGDLSVAIALYNYLKNCSAKVEVSIIGLCCSAATVLACAANKGKLAIAKNAFFMIHQGSSIAIGSSADMRQQAEVLDMYNKQMADILGQRAGKTAEQVQALWATGDYWMTGEEAVTQGFADSTFNDAPPIQIAARLEGTQFNNLPASIRAQMKPEANNDNKTFFQETINDMKTFFKGIKDEIKAALTGVKVTDADNEAVTAKLSDAIAKPFENLDENINTAVNASLDEAKPKAIEDITASVKAELKKDEVKPETPEEFNARVQPLIDAAVDAKTKDLQMQLTQIVGNASSTAAPAATGKKAPVGGFRTEE